MTSQVQNSCLEDLNSVISYLQLMGLKLILNKIEKETNAVKITLLYTELNTIISNLQSSKDHFNWKVIHMKSIINYIMSH